MTVVMADARALLPKLQPNVVLMDPMHPQRRKTALVKKEIRQLQQIVGADDDSGTLLEVALSWARRRVVLKWPARVPLPRSARLPTFEIRGKIIRYVVYSCKSRETNSEL
jgi:16S rRNA (guanine1516-N2)-methyltransferase